MTEVGDQRSPEFKFDPRSIGIATTTFYPNWYPGNSAKQYVVDKIRGDLALQTIQESVKNGFQVVVNDGTSSDAFQEELKRLKGEGVIVLARTEPGMSATRRQVFQEVSYLPGVKVILWTEPEKTDLVQYASKISQPILEGKAHLVVIKREPELFKQMFPDYMYESEIKANRRYNNWLRIRGLLKKDQEDLDMFSGPRAFLNKPQVLELFFKVYEFIGDRVGIQKYADPEMYSDATYFPVVAALAEGLNVVSVTIPFKYPEEQRKIEETTDPEILEEFIKKRLKQRLGILDDLVQYLQLQRKSPRAKLREVKKQEKS